MYNAAIVVFRRSTLPKLLKFFAMPVVEQVIEAGTADKRANVYIMECPVLKAPEYNRKVFKSLKSLFLENNISMFIGRNTDYYLGSGLEYVENSIERSNIDEVKAIKALAALIKLSGERNADLLKTNMCFIGSSIGYRYISTMCEEASGVFIYEHEKMDGSYKNTVYQKLMENKGISAAFTKDLGKAISQCDIIMADASVELVTYQAELSGKILIGENPAEGDFKKIGQVLLWCESLEGLTEDDLIIRYNDEMLEILRYFYRERNLLAFLKRFPYIHVAK